MKKECIRSTETNNARLAPVGANLFPILKIPLVFIFLLIFSFGKSYAQDTSCGIIWYPPIQLSDSTHDGYQPRIALSGNDTVHATYEYGGKRLAYARSTTGGTNFETVREMLPDTVQFPREANWPFVVADNNDVYLFFVNPEAPYPYSSHVRMLFSSDGGTTFGSVQDISADRSGILTWATISGDTIALLYPPQPSEREILYSTNHGVTWTQLSEQYKSTARIAVSSGGFHLVQQPRVNGPFEITYRQSTDLGNSWTSDTVISTMDNWSSDLPTIASNTTKCGTELLVAWRDTKYGWIGFAGASIISRAGLANGRLWLPENLLTIDPNGYNASAAIHGNVRGVSWDAEISPYDTIHPIVRATNGSLLNYCPAVDLTPAMFRAGNQSIAVSSHAINLVWEQKVGNTFRIFYRRGEFIPSNASFSLSSGLIEFDSTEINATTNDTVTITNSGTDPLVIGTAVSDHPESFSIMPASDTLPSSTSHFFIATYTPKSYGMHAGKIIFYHNGQSATGGSPDCFAVTGVSKWNSSTISYQPQSWNLVSVPLQPNSKEKLPSLFGYDGSYVARDSLMFGYGYWAKPDTSEIRFEGTKTYSASVSVKSGWNIIGSVSEPVPAIDIITVPDSIIISGIYGYDGANYFVADTLFPGRGYWIKVNQAGKIILAVNDSMGSTPRTRIVVSEELPPPPPDNGNIQRRISNIPAAFSLDQNYPNPFNPTTVIRYQLPVGQEGIMAYNVSLKVYNELGQEVKILVNEMQDAGYKTVEWDAGTLPSGVYVYKFMASSAKGGAAIQMFTDVKKAIVIK